MVWGCCEQHTPVTTGDVEVLATHILFFSFCSLPSRMLSVISARWIWGGCVTGVTLPTQLPSHDFRAWCTSIWCTSRLQCPFQCVINKKCQTFQFVSVCFKLFRLFFLLLIVFTFLLLVFLCQVVPVFLACCKKCYCVFHGCSLFSECLWVSSWGSLMVWCCFRLLWHVAICLYRLLIAVCRFLCLFFCIVLSRLGSSRCLAFFYIIVGL